MNSDGTNEWIILYFFPGLPLNHSKVNLIPFCRERMSTKKLNLCSLWLAVSDVFVETTGNRIAAGSVLMGDDIVGGQ